MALKQSVNADFANLSRRNRNQVYYLVCYLKEIKNIASHSC